MSQTSLGTRYAEQRDSGHWHSPTRPGTVTDVKGVICVTGEKTRGLLSAAIVVAAVASCSVDGTPHDSPIARTVDPSAFPADSGSEPIVVPGKQLSFILPDVSGYPDGAVFEPANCELQQIPLSPQRTSAQTGYGPDTKPGSPMTAYTTVITQTAASLDDLAATVRRCGRYRHDSGEKSSTIEVAQRTLTNLPTVAGAETLGYSRTDGYGGPEWAAATTTLLIAQRGSIRVYAAQRVAQHGEPVVEPDEALVKLFHAVADTALH
ncbi:hypothetical protein HUN08_09885 [Gordonia sp. X0973]|uniref:hypothetical protein n=1 Tax=Gordonia sp. X0973 TaxID=2742602 RepID=UPI000F532595|nr:hypothetical protein [Gordonia sp. X0973]QKT07470.1 hypothetical protein HUN08_09885 [Gordonia sp. X0973]